MSKYTVNVIYKHDYTSLPFFVSKDIFNKYLALIKEHDPKVDGVANKDHQMIPFYVKIPSNLELDLVTTDNEKLYKVKWIYSSHSLLSKLNTIPCYVLKSQFTRVDDDELLFL